MAHDIPLFRNLGSLIRGRMARSSASAASTPSTGPAVSVASASAASAAAKAATAEPFAAVERLAGGVAHDFNNIMLVVRGYAELALGEEDLGPKAKAHLQEVMSALTRATELIGQLLAVGRRASSLLAEIDLNESVSRALEQARASRARRRSSQFRSRRRSPSLPCLRGPAGEAYRQPHHVCRGEDRERRQAFSRNRPCLARTRPGGRCVWSLTFRRARDASAERPRRRGA